MWSSIFMAIELIIGAMSAIAEQVNVLALGILKASRFSDLFLTLVLTSSLSTAVAVLLIGCFWPAGKTNKQLILGEMPQRGNAIRI